MMRIAVRRFSGVMGVAGTEGLQMKHESLFMYA